MLQYAIKILITAALVVAVSEAAKRSSAFGALLASLPLTSLLAFLWLYADTSDVQQVARLSRSIFWYVLPSLVLFLALPALLTRGVGFWPSLGVAVGLTFVAYLAMTTILARFGVDL